MESIIDRIVKIMDLKKWKKYELANAMGISSASVSGYFSGSMPSYESIVRLVSACPEISSKWILTGEGSMKEPVASEFVTLGVSGEIAAGVPTEISEVEPLDYVNISTTQLGNPYEYIALRVYGDSMAPVIVHNDIILLHTRFDPFDLDGQICAVKVDQEVTLKRIWINEAARQTVLLPYNHHYKPLVLSEDSPDCRIIGYMVSMIRNF